MMTIIEGIGDEVVYSVGFAIFVIIVALAWSSTSVSDHTFIRTAVLVIERRRRLVVATPSTNSSSNTADVVEPQEAGLSSSTANVTVTSNETASATCEATPSGKVAQKTETKQPTTSKILENEICSAPSSGPNVENEVERILGQTLQSEREPQIVDLSQSQHKVTNANTERAIDNSNVGNGERPTAEIPTIEITHTSSDHSGSGEESTLPSEDHIRVRLKFLNETQKLVEARLADQLGQFKQQHFGEELGSNKIVRLIFNGQLLQRDQETLQFYGLFDNCVVHCHISNNATVPTAPTFSPQVELDLGRLMLPLFGLILGLIWCCRIQYRQYFNATSTLALLCITGLFVVSVLAVCLPTRHARIRGQ